MSTKKPDTWMQGIDTVLIGIESEKNTVRAEVLYPYRANTIKVPNSHSGMKERVAIVDKIILTLVSSG